MKIDKVEKIIKRKLQNGKSLQEQTTPEEFAQISFESAIETMIEVQKTMINKKKSDALIEQEIKDWASRIVIQCGNDYIKALGFIPD